MHTSRNIRWKVPRAPVLILDLLVPGDTPLSSQAICRAGALMGISETTVRVSLTRLVAKGKICRSQRGLYSLNRDTAALSRTVDQWQQKHALAMKWRPGDWVAVQDAGVPRTDKPMRRHHELSLSLNGFVELRTGLHIRPNNLKGGVKAQSVRLRELGLAPQALVFRLSTLEPQLEAEAMALWDVERLQRAHQGFIASLEESARQFRRVPLDVAVRESLLLGRSVIAHLVRDPVLPIELMAGASRERLLALARDYQHEARALWAEWFDEQS
jgi:phenylacetic acid degradation operon negative regulatory protein